ncbi:hypothetical protein SBA3_2010016 [Candidatus Sulfopaludibacter sp. SbA3]|nr:hypothetical protein SBA3_2010016 [Candidatus Sulfopaludibacter sp. SbA3]
MSAGARFAGRRICPLQSKCDGRSLAKGADSTETLGAGGADIPAAESFSATGCQTPARTATSAIQQASAHP